MDKKIVIDKKHFSEQGYGIARGLFSQDDMSAMRSDVYKQFEIDKAKGLTYKVPGIQARFVKGDLLSKEILYKVLLDERILAVARQVLGNNDLVYFGDSSYQIGTGSNGFHRDNIDRSNLDGPDWQGRYTLLRIGLYLQDHKRSSGGLKIRKGSHRHPGGKAIFVDSGAGDLVFWDLKTLHSGNAVRLKAMPELSVNLAVLERNIPGFLRQDEEQERISLFMTFALKSNHLHRYLTEYTLKRKDTVEHAELSTREAHVLEKAASRNVKVVDPLKDRDFIHESQHVTI